MKKRILAMLLTVMLMVSLLPVGVLAADATSGTCGENVTWSFDEASGALTISGTGEIGYMSFAGFEGLKSVTISEGITSIGDSAFYWCKELTSVTIPNSVINIKDYAFESCESLTSVTIPGSVTSIGNCAFQFCYGLSSVTICEGVTSIGNFAFASCNGLKHMTIPDSVTTFGVQPFAQCSGLISVILPNGLTTIGDMFAGCSALTSVMIPDSITSIGRYTFDTCVSLKDIYYTGSLEQWDKVVVAEGNSYLEAATVHPYWGCNHTETTKIPGIAATCKKTGLTEGAKCVRCGEVVTEQEKIPALEHKVEAVPGVAATCTENGLTEGSKCSVCGEIIIAQESVLATGHLEVIDAAVAATCEAAGKTEGKHCSVCGAVIDAQKEVPAKGHSYVDGKCTVCGAADPNYVAPTPTPTPTPAPVENPFTDVADDAWYAAPVLWAKSNGVTGGKTETTFGPEDSCTRAQVVTFLWAANGKPEPKSENPFTDVAENAWYLKPVLWAVENGITTGVTATEFGPEKTCTRAQIATFLYAAAGKPEVKGSSTFSDVADGDWFAKPVIWAKENDVTGGISPTEFGPNNVCTRAQVVTFLYKVYG